MEQLGTGRGFRAGRISWEQERKRVLLDIFSQFVQDVFEVSRNIDASFFEGAQDGHQNAPRMGSRIGLGTKADLAGNHRGSKVSFGQVIFCGDISILGPVVEAGFIFPEDILKASDAQMLGGAFYGCADLPLHLPGFSLKLLGRKPLVAQPHRKGE